MIKYLNYRPFVNEAEGKPYVECTGLSTDTKPNEVSLNSLFLELDTKTLYYCSKSGGESEEVIFEGDGLSHENVWLEPTVDGTTLPDTINVIWDGNTYTCNKQTYQFDEYTLLVWGAPLVDYMHDYSTYPFALTSGDEDTNDLCVVLPYGDNDTHTLTISQTVETSAEWTEYGEAPSSDMINVYFMSPSDGPYTDFTTQMTRDGEITLPTASSSGKWICTNGGSTQYDYGSSFTIPNEECIFTEDGGGRDYILTAPYIQFTIEQPVD